MSLEAQIRERRQEQLRQMNGKVVNNEPNKVQLIYKALQDSLVKEESDLLVKGKELPVGTIRQRGDQNWIKTGDSKNPWKYHSKVGSKKAKEANVSSSVEEDVEEINDEDYTPEKMGAKTLASKLFTLVNKVGAAKTFGEQMALMYSAGITDPEKVVELTNADLSDVLTHMQHSKITPKTQNFSIKDELAKLNAQPAIQTGFKKVPVKKRWESYRVFLDMVADGTAKSMIAYGTGGIGKTYNATRIFAKHNLAEFDSDVHEPQDANYDYVKITGKTSPTALYAALHEHNGKCLMFDDCDSVLEHDDSINILKGALDSGGDNAISYASGKKMKDSRGNTIPQRFKFTGRVAFITNLTAEQMPQPLRSRAFTADLTMTPEETVEMMQDIIHKIEFQNSRGEAIAVNTEDRQDAMDFVAENVHNISVQDLNSRTLGQIALLKRKLGDGNGAGLDWKTAAISMLS